MIVKNEYGDLFIIFMILKEVKVKELIVSPKGNEFSETQTKE